MTNNFSAYAYQDISQINYPREISPEAFKYVKTIVGANTDLPISDIMEMLNQIYIVSLIRTSLYFDNILL